MNKALVLVEALASIQTSITDGEWYGDNEGLILNIHSIAEDAVNTVGGHEEVEHMFEDLRLATVDLDVTYDHIMSECDLENEDIQRIINCIVPVLTIVDDLTDLGVSGA